MSDTNWPEEIGNFFLTLLKVLFFSLWGSIRALIPNGMLPRKSVSGDKCLVTGSGSGIGRQMAIELGKLGCTVILWDVNAAGNEQTKKMLTDQGIKAHAYTVDLSDRNAINATADKVKKEVGDVDILINNAGIVTGKKIFDCPDELMEKTMAVNTSALLYAAKNFVPSMLKRNHGHIVTIASMAGKAGTAGLVDYCASKHGAVGFHESLTSELRALKADGVKTTVVCPYYIDTGMFDGVVTKSPNVLPILQPAYVVECILEALLTNREELQLPRFAYFVNAFANMLPSEAKHVCADYFGVHESMENFKGRKASKAH